MSPLFVFILRALFSCVLFKEFVFSALNTCGLTQTSPVSQHVAMTHELHTHPPGFGAPHTTPKFFPRPSLLTCLYGHVLTLAHKHIKITEQSLLLAESMWLFGDTL